MDEAMDMERLSGEDRAMAAALELIAGMTSDASDPITFLPFDSTESYSCFDEGADGSRVAHFRVDAYDEDAPCARMSIDVCCEDRPGSRVDAWLMTGYGRRVQRAERMEDVCSDMGAASAWLRGAAERLKNGLDE